MKFEKGLLREPETFVTEIGCRGARPLLCFSDRTFLDLFSDEHIQADLKTIRANLNRGSQLTLQHKRT